MKDIGKSVLDEDDKVNEEAEADPCVDGDSIDPEWLIVTVMYLVLWTGIAIFLFCTAPVVGVAYVFTLVIGVGIRELFVPKGEWSLFRIRRRRDATNQYP